MTRRSTPPAPCSPLFTSEPVEMTLHPAVRPAWMRSGDVLRLPVSSLLPCDREGETLVAFTWEGRTLPGILRDDAGTHIYFDANRTVRDILRERHVRVRRPWMSRLPFHYHRVPAFLRGAAASFLTAGGGKPSPAAFPSFPLEKGLHALVHVLGRCDRRVDEVSTNALRWPEGKRYCVVLTHDVDTARGFRIAPRVRDLERALALRSSWNVVGSLFGKSRKAIDALHGEGCEIGLHGHDHRLKMPFLPPHAIARKLEKTNALRERYAVSGFRSPCYLRTEALFSALQGAFQYDSSVPDVDIFTPGRGPGGCCLAAPYRIGDLVELPVTLPFEIPLHLGCRAGDLNRYWAGKIAWIRQAGGMILVNTHPEPQYLGRPAVLQAYEELLQTLSGDPDAWYALPAEIAALNCRTRAASAGPCSGSDETGSSGA